MTTLEVDRKPVGFLGLGSMGLAMVQRLVEDGFTSYVFDPVPDRVARAVMSGAIACGSPADVADHASCVCASLPAPEAAETAFFGSDGVIHGKSIRQVIDFSTIGPAAAGLIVKRLEGARIAYVEAPVSGGPATARAGQLSIMLAGASDYIAVASPVLASLSAQHRVVGMTPGAAQGMKLVNNLVGLANLALVSEALVLAAALGIDGATATDVLNDGVARSHVSEAWVPEHVLTRSFDYGFSMGLAAKDMRLCLGQVGALGLRLPVAETIAECWTRAAEDEGGEADITAFIRTLEKKCRLIVQGRAA